MGKRIKNVLSPLLAVLLVFNMTVLTAAAESDDPAGDTPAQTIGNDSQPNESDTPDDTEPAESGDTDPAEEKTDDTDAYTAELNGPVRAPLKLGDPAPKAGEDVAQVIDSDGQVIGTYTQLGEALAAWTDGTTLKLLADVQIEKCVKVENKTVTLDLNGHKLEKVSTETGSYNETIWVESGSLTIADTSEGKTGTVSHSGSAGVGVTVRSAAAATLSGGTITGNFSGGVTSFGAFTMTGGEISGNTSDTNAGGVAVLTGTFNMTGGKITNNQYTGTYWSNRAGGVYVQSSGRFSISGEAEISGNTAAGNNRGGVSIIEAASMSVSGSPKITGNTAGGTPNNVYLSAGKKISVTGRLGEETSIGVTTETAPTAGNPVELTQGCEGFGQSSYFKSDNTAYRAIWNSSYTEIILSLLFRVTIAEDIENGEAFIYGAQEYYPEGEKVYIVAKPATGYEVKKVFAKAGDNEIESTLYMDNIYSFPMPAADVVAYAEFSQPQKILIEFGGGKQSDAKKAYDEWSQSESAVSRVIEENGIEYEEGDTFVALTVKPDVKYEALNSALSQAMMGIAFSEIPYYALIPGDEGPMSEVAVLGKKDISGYDYSSFVSEYNSIKDLHMDELFPAPTSSDSLYVLWGTPIAKFDITCKPLICGTEVEFDEDTEIQTPAPELTYDKSLAKDTGGTWRGKGDDGYSEWSFVANGNEKYALAASFTADFGKVFGEISEVTVNGAKAKLRPESDDDPVMVPMGSILQVYGLIQAEHDWDPKEVVVKEPTLNETGLAEIRCRQYDVCEAVRETKEIDKITYYIASGDGNVWTKGSGKTSDFTFKRTFSDVSFRYFTGIEVDGKEVEKTNYTAVEGSTIVKLNPAYLETLSIGGHTLTAKFTETDGSAEVPAKFTVKEKSSGGGSSDKKPNTPADNVVTCQMAGYPSNYTWNEAAKACQPGYMDAGGNFHPYGKSVPKTADNANNPLYAWIFMLAISAACYCGVRLLHEDWEV